MIDIVNNKFISNYMLNFVNEDTFKKCNNEEELRVEFQNQLNVIARELDLTKTYLSFRNEIKLKEGRSDFLYGNTIIEYKRYNRLSNDNELNSAIKQLKEYMMDDKFENFQIFGFIFDGVKLEHYIKTQNNKITKIFEGKIDIKNALILIKTIFQNGIRQISSMNIQRDFAILSNGGTMIENTVTLDLLREIYNLLNSKTNKKTELLYLEWEKLFKLSEKDNGKSLDIEKRIEIFTKLMGTDIKKEEEYKVLFSLHTTLNIIIKLFLTKSTSTLKELFMHIEYLEKYYKTNNMLKLKKFMENIESGKYFEQLNIINLVDGDFFSWYLTENWNEKIFEILKKILMLIDNYDFDGIEFNNTMLGDLFKGLYENFIPKVVRHSFGEYHTPSYLVKYILDILKLKNKDYINKTFIDPCCGSGTFILELYNNKMRALSKKIDFQDFFRFLLLL